MSSTLCWCDDFIHSYRRPAEAHPLAVSSATFQSASYDWKPPPPPPKRKVQVFGIGFCESDTPSQDCDNRIRTGWVRLVSRHGALFDSFTTRPPTQSSRIHDPTSSSFPDFIIYEGHFPVSNLIFFHYPAIDNRKVIRIYQA